MKQLSENVLEQISGGFSVYGKDGTRVEFGQSDINTTVFVDGARVAIAADGVATITTSAAVANEGDDGGNNEVVDDEVVDDDEIEAPIDTPSVPTSASELVAQLTSDTGDDVSLDAFNTLLSPTYGADLVDKLGSLFDADESGLVSSTEFVPVFDNVTSIFSTLDTTGSDQLSGEELLGVVTQGAVELEEGAAFDVVNSVLNTYDATGDGLLDVFEFHGLVSDAVVYTNALSGTGTDVITTGANIDETLIASYILSLGESTTGEATVEDEAEVEVEDEDEAEVEDTLGATDPGDTEALELTPNADTYAPILALGTSEERASAALEIYDADQSSSLSASEFNQLYVDFSASLIEAGTLTLPNALVAAELVYDQFNVDSSAGMSLDELVEVYGGPGETA